MYYSSTSSDQEPNEACGMYILHSTVMALTHLCTAWHYSRSRIEVTLSRVSTLQGHLVPAGGHFPRIARHWRWKQAWVKPVEALDHGHEHSKDCRATAKENLGAMGAMGPFARRCRHRRAQIGGNVTAVETGNPLLGRLVVYYLF